ncbi:UNVERIFIED_CONTAM: Oxidoreductase [Siphonaria sp. JEL0065]|nr:Oxidoreductase [Siphonaria sp. JEL0065]
MPSTQQQHKEQRIDFSEETVAEVPPPVATEKSQPEEQQTQDSQQEQPTANDPASQQAQAYNPETGEINWDCPCLGPMTQPPCGEKFKAAFSCFVYSEQEPKGLDCIEQFREMQLCFREYPEIYGDDAQDDDDDDDDDDSEFSDSEDESEDDDDDEEDSDSDSDSEDDE